MDRFLRRHFDRARENTHRGPDGRLYQTRGGSGRRTYPDDEGWGRSEWHPPSSYHGEGSGRMPSSSHRRRPSPSPAYGRSSFSGSRGGGEEPGSFWNTPEGERYIEEHWGSLDEFDGGHTSRGRSRSHRAPSPEMYDEPHFDYRGPGMSHSQSHRTPRYDYGEPGISRRSSHRSSFDHHEGGGYGPRIEIRTPGGGSRYGGGHSVRVTARLAHHTHSRADAALDELHLTTEEAMGRHHRTWRSVGQAWRPVLGVGDLLRAVALVVRAVGLSRVCSAMIARTGAAASTTRACSTRLVACGARAVTLRFLIVVEW